MLAQFLLENGIRTYYVNGTRRIAPSENIQTHAWLLTDNQVIIDIIGDQFRNNPSYMNYNKSVYVGKKDSFHELFRVEDSDIRENIGLDSLNSMCRLRLNGLYNKIIKLF